MNYEKQRRQLEKDGAEWFDTLKKLKSLTTSIINEDNSTIENIYNVESVSELVDLIKDLREDK